MGDKVLFNQYYRGDELELRSPLRCTFTHSNGAKESISDFVKGKRNHAEYKQCVDVTTWMLQGCKIIMGQDRRRDLLGHPSFGTEICFVIYLDVNISEEELSPAYVAVFLLATELNHFCLVAQEIDDHCLRRVGLATLWYDREVRKDSKRSGNLTWLPGKELRNSFNEWKLKTVRLV
jgi:hypothetical protein